MTYTGYLQLKVEKKQNRSVISNSFFDGVLKITRPTYLPEGLPLLTLIHVGGGYVDGDSYRTEVVVDEGAKLALTSQASTKIYKSPRFGVTQKMDYFLKNNSELYVKQDSLIPYKDAKFSQQTNVYMESTSTFYYTDVVTPGWSEDGKLFQYEKVASKMKIFIDGRLQVFDHQLLVPDQNLHQFMQLEGYTHLGTFFMIHPHVNELLIEKIREALSSSIDARFGISLLNIPGLVLRVLANSTPVIERIFSVCETVIRKELDEKELIEWRKW
ncbi:urease accessory protein UreD [Metabacillus endolithicus]|uniref:Urease accessory protein UreD n=1 Tax=Metabacillus endolithicus TaxID=1535204 RepID=A0ABW5BZM5_9BACI|nr:urease accessory protein UreD [Metabacillus endolithicus]UPG64413.1 urease accessory protein UreD [Metabacillus endolithicus]